VKIDDIGEIELIKKLSKGFRLDNSVVKGSGDDTAVIKWSQDKYLLFTCDMVIEGVHFDLKRAKPFQAGWKALARNISDVAAMGGLPKYAVVSLAISPKADVSVAEGICKGLKSAADRFGVSIVGGDMAESKKIMIDVSLIGQARKKDIVLRSGAKEGDLILVTGSLGGSIKGKHLDFIPRVEESQAIVKNFRINSMIDVSDGLALDLYRILHASGAGAILYEGLIPLSKDAAGYRDALYGGEDYELLFTAAPKEVRRLLKANFSKFGTRVSVIGEITDKRCGYRILREDGREEQLKAEGYTHFGKDF
jgi:thiamine-monophosphate kinase